MHPGHILSFGSNNVESIAPLSYIKMDMDWDDVEIKYLSDNDYDLIEEDLK